MKRSMLFLFAIPLLLTGCERVEGYARLRIKQDVGGLISLINEIPNFNKIEIGTLLQFEVIMDESLSNKLESIMVNDTFDIVDTLEFEVTEPIDYIITPNFVEEPIDTKGEVKVENSVGGNINVDKTSGNVGDEITINVSIDEGYILSKLFINDEEVALNDNNIYTFTLNQGINTVSAEFLKITEDKSSVKIITPIHGTITSDKTEGLLGEEVNLTIIPDEGYKLSKLLINNYSVAIDSSLTNYKFNLIKGINTVEGIFKTINTEGNWDYSYLYNATKIEQSRGTQGSIESYYEPCRGLKGKELKDALHNIIDGHTEFSYGSSTAAAMKYYDADPFNKSNMIYAYEESLKNTTAYNKEHTWAKSHGGFSTSKPAGSDYHNLRASDSNLNSTRNNYNFGEVKVHDNSTSITKQYTKWARPTMEGCYIGTGKNISERVFEPRDSTKGDTARIIFYMATRYSGEGEPFLEVSGNIPNTFYDYTTLSGVTGVHGNFIDLYNWLEIDPVDDFEVNRNNVIDQKYQHNRNPFVDHPEFVRMIYDKTYDGPGALEE